MIFRRAPKDLHAAHTEDAISTRLASATEHSYIGDFTLGAIDGTVTTLAVVAGVAGAGLRNEVAIALGFANLVADGFSMAVGNYLRAKSDLHVVERARKMEEEHIERVPDGEREEVRQIFLKKGIEGEVLDQVVGIITSDRKRWVNTMITEEWGLSLENPDPIKAGAITFASFCFVGLIPLLPFLVPALLESEFIFQASILVSAMGFFGVGYFRGTVLRESKIKMGMETLLMGGCAALIAYGIGFLCRDLLGTF